MNAYCVKRLTAQSIVLEQRQHRLQHRIVLTRAKGGAILNRTLQLNVKQSTAQRISSAPLNNTMRHSPELVHEHADARPRLQLQHPVARLDRQPALDVVHGHRPAEQQQRVRRHLRRVAQEHLRRLVPRKVRHKVRLPRRRAEEDRARVQEHARAVELAEAELLRGVRALHRARGDLVELDRARGERHARDARPERARDHALEQVLVRAVRVQRAVRRREAEGDEAGVGERAEEVVPEGADVAHGRRRDEVLPRRAGEGRSERGDATAERTCSQ